MLPEAWCCMILSMQHSSRILSKHCSSTQDPKEGSLLHYHGNTTGLINLLGRDRETKQTADWPVAGTHIPAPKSSSLHRSSWRMKRCKGRLPRLFYIEGLVGSSLFWCAWHIGMGLLRFWFDPFRVCRVLVPRPPGGSCAACKGYSASTQGRGKTQWRKHLESCKKFNKVARGLIGWIVVIVLGILMVNPKKRSFAIGFFRSKSKCVENWCLASYQFPPWFFHVLSGFIQAKLAVCCMVDISVVFLNQNVAHIMKAESLCF